MAITENTARSIFLRMSFSPLELYDRIVGKCKETLEIAILSRQSWKTILPQQKELRQSGDPAVTRSMTLRPPLTMGCLFEDVRL
jgi:hypothetical protein